MAIKFKRLKIYNEKNSNELGTNIVYRNVKLYNVQYFGGRMSWEYIICKSMHFGDKYAPTPKIPRSIKKLNVSFSLFFIYDWWNFIYSISLIYISVYMAASVSDNSYWPMVIMVVENGMLITDQLAISCTLI